MAERRMMAKSVIETDMFMDMPMSTQCLYFHLLLRADDDGFIRNPSAIRRETGCSQDDFKLLVAKQYIIPFESGVIVIRHWKIHNYIRKDRYNETDCPEKDELELDASNAYKIKASSGSDTNGTPLVYQKDTDCQPNDNHVVDEMDTQVRLGKVRLVTTTTTAREDDDWKKVAESFSKNVHPISGAIERDRLIDLMDSFSSDWLLAAIDEAVVSSNGGISIKYLASILERWKREGFRSERKKKGATNGNTRTSRRPRGGTAAIEESECIQKNRKEYEEWQRYQEQHRPWDVQPEPGGTESESGGDPAH